MTLNRPQPNESAKLRQREIERLRMQLEDADFPRLKMMLIVGLTGLGGFLASYVALHLGLESMTVRYPVAVGVAYLVFLFLLWLWLRTKAEDYDELPEVDFSSRRCGSDDGAGVGESGGDVPVDSGDAGTGLGDVAEAIGGADEFAIPLIVLVLIAALVLASGWIVYSAPLLFAELLVDGVLAASLYRRLKGLETRHWLETAFRRTALPFVFTAVTFCVAGALMQSMAPEANSLGGFLHRQAGGGMEGAARAPRNLAGHR